MNHLKGKGFTKEGARRLMNLLEPQLWSETQRGETPLSTGAGHVYASVSSMDCINGQLHQHLDLFSMGPFCPINVLLVNKFFFWNTELWYFVKLLQWITCCSSEATSALLLKTPLDERGIWEISQDAVEWDFSNIPLVKGGFEAYCTSGF